MSLKSKEKKFSLTKLKNKSEWLIYLLPFLIGIIIFTLYPIVNVFLISFKENFNYLVAGV